MDIKQHGLEQVFAVAYRQGGDIGQVGLAAGKLQGGGDQCKTGQAPGQTAETSLEL